MRSHYGAECLEVMFQEVVAGFILLQTNSDIKHDGIFLSMEGSVNLQLSSKNFGIFEAFYNSVKVRIHFCELYEVAVSEAGVDNSSCNVTYF